ncbi:hypothetical protein [Streptomyces sp. NPDC127098]|uniref:hypothetical protein n=1 Tax=Streptomyces sp. NPDC127098 TaxID=3347137 RepID=UPI0036526FD8
MRRVLARWWPFALPVLLGALLGAGYALLAEREYAASGYVVVRAAGEADPAAAVGLAQSYGRMATSEAVLDAAREEAGGSAAELRGRVRAATSPDAPVIEITGRAPGAEAAARAANAVARALIGYAAEAEPETAAELVELMPARAPATPVSPAPLLSLAVGTCAGALLGTVIQLARAPAAGRPASAGEPVPTEEPGRGGESVPVGRAVPAGASEAAGTLPRTEAPPAQAAPPAEESDPVEERASAAGTVPAEVPSAQVFLPVCVFEPVGECSSAVEPPPSAEDPVPAARLAGEADTPVGGAAPLTEKNNPAPALPSG